MKGELKRLAAIYKELTPGERKAILDFAERFKAETSGEIPQYVTQLVEDICNPETDNVDNWARFDSIQGEDRASFFCQLLRRRADGVAWEVINREGITWLN